MFYVYLEALKDPKLIFLCIVAGIVALLTGKTIASRPAAVITKRVAISNTLHHIFFMLTRFANLFYGPLLAVYVSRAVKTGDLNFLNIQLRLIIWGSFLGSLLLWVLLPTLIEIFCAGIRAFEKRESMVKVIFLALYPKNFPKILKCFRRPTNFGVSLFRLDGIPPGFLIFNIIATGIWTVGVLCALYVSAMLPQYKITAVLLSGLVNSVAAIIFSTLVDPKASIITDQVISGKRPQKHIYIMSVFLTAGSVLGMILAQFLFMPGVTIIEFATLKLAQGIGGSMFIVIALAIIVSILYSTNVTSRISAVITGRVATAIAVYNLFFLITRLAQQIYAPIIGVLVDSAMANKTVPLLEAQLRWIIFSGSIGTLIGWLLIPTFIQIYNKAVSGIEKYGSLPMVLLLSMLPQNWAHWIKCMRPPSLLGVKLKDIKEIPRPFLVYNIIVIAIHAVGVLAATFAGALRPEFARQATLLSGVVNGVATILMGIIVDPIASLITDQAVSNERPKQHVKTIAVFLTAGMFIGTLFSQLIFLPCAYFINWCSEAITMLF